MISDQLLNVKIMIKWNSTPQRTLELEIDFKFRAEYVYPFSPFSSEMGLLKLKLPGKTDQKLKVKVVQAEGCSLPPIITLSYHISYSALMYIERQKLRIF